MPPTPAPEPDSPRSGAQGDVDPSVASEPPATRRRRSRLLLAGAGVALVVVAAATVVSFANRTPGQLTIADSVVLGVIEGITEYLPVSSTGHLTVALRLLDIVVDDATEAAADSYAISIQLGAILAVLVLYWRRVTSVAAGFVGRDPVGRRLGIHLLVAFVPAAVVGLALGDAIKDNLFSIWTVVAAWIVGGVAILVLTPRVSRGVRALEDLTTRDAALIGVAQVAALWPGMSRSLVTILAAMALGLAARPAVEFSFLLGLGTLGAATVYETLQEGGTVVEQFGLAAPLVGAATATVAAVVAVRWLVEYLSRRSLAIFGWYRLGIAAVVGALALSPAI